MWASKLGLDTFDPALFLELMRLMVETPVDYTIFFRELSDIPDDLEPLRKSFYSEALRPQDEQSPDVSASDHRWSEWLNQWKSRLGIGTSTAVGASAPRSREAISARMKRVNPKYTLREWLVVPAYQRAAAGDYSLLREIQEVMTQPYAEQSRDVEDRYYRIKPLQYFHKGGISHYSCSS